MDATDASIVAPSDDWWGAGAVRTEISRAGDRAATVDEVASEYRQDLGNIHQSARGDDGIGPHSGEDGFRDDQNDAYDAPNDLNPDVPTCLCHAPCTRLMSRSERNPNRWFYKCAKFKDDPSQCKFFVWEDGFLATKFPSQAPQERAITRPPRVDQELGIHHRSSIPNQTSPSEKRADALAALVPKSEGPLASDQDQCFKCGLFGHWARDCPTEKVSGLVSGRLTSQPQSGPSQTNNAATGYVPLSRTGHCYRCGGEGHWARDCPDSSQNTKPAATQRYYSNPVNTGGNFAGPQRGSCYVCGEEGHWARECPQKTGSLAGNKRPYAGVPSGGSSGACFKCGQSGHWSNACPKR